MWPSGFIADQIYKGTIIAGFKKESRQTKKCSHEACFADLGEKDTFGRRYEQNVTGEPIGG